MAGKIVLVFAILAVTSTSWIKAAPIDDDDSFSLNPYTVKPKCGLNEYWLENGSSCHPTCQEPEIFFCVRMSMSSCVCKEGYIRRSSQSECIEIKNCPSQNEVDAENKN